MRRSNLDKIVIASFDEVTRDLKPMIQDVNTMFGTDYQSEPTAAIKSTGLGWHAGPNDKRDEIKDALQPASMRRWQQTPTFAAS